MPYEIQWEAPLGVVLAFSGEIQGGQLIRAVEEVHSSVTYDQLRYVIDDLSEVTVFDVNSEVIEDIFASSVGAGLSNPHRRIYVVATIPCVVEHLDRMMKLYEGGLPIELHDSMASARNAIKAQLVHEPSGSRATA